MTLGQDQDKREAWGQLADVLAYLRRRRANALTIATRGDPENAEWARDRARQLEVIIGDFEAGVHLGCAMIEAQLAGAAAEQGAE